VFLTGTLLNVATVLVGTLVGVLLGARMPVRMQASLTTGLGLFTLLFGLSMGLRIFTDPDARPGDDLAVLGALLLGVAIGELLRIHDGLERLGAWFQRRLASADDARPSRVAEGFVTASLVFCVGPLTILGSLANGLTGDVGLLALKSLLDGVASVAFAAGLGPGVALSALTVLVVQGAIAAGAFLLRDVLDDPTILAITARRWRDPARRRAAAPGAQAGAGGELPAFTRDRTALRARRRPRARPPDLDLRR
jgi:uncharacterized membrane protein YqgA involved in biofilm formation